MVAVILGIMKWVGIAVLILLSVLLLLVLCILFLPLVYKIRIRGGKQWEISGSASWMFHLLHISFGGDKERRYCFRIAGIPLGGNTRKKSGAGKQRADKKRKPGSRKEEKQDKLQKTEKNAGPEAAPKLETKEKKLRDSDRNVKTVEKSTGEEKKKRKSRILAKWKRKIENFILSIRSIFVKIKTVDSETLELLRLLAVNAGGLLRYILPRRIKGWLRIGMADPAMTGQILGGISILFALTGRSADVFPEFEEEIFECDLLLKGRLQGFMILLFILRTHPLRQMERFGADR